MRAKSHISKQSALFGGVCLAFLVLAACESPPSQTEVPEDTTSEADTDTTDDVDIVDTNTVIVSDDDEDVIVTAPDPYQCGPFTAYSQTEFACLPVGQVRQVHGDSTVYQGSQLTDVWFANMRFPLQRGPAYLNSQVYGYRDSDAFNPNQIARSGSPLGAPQAGLFYNQCDTRNFSFPWEDNFCEKRDYGTRMCPSGEGHRGVDIRGATCGSDVERLGGEHIKVVAATSGYITSIDRHRTRAVSEDGSMIFYYYHMNPAAGKRTYDTLDLIAENNRIRIERGDVLGEIGRVGAGNTFTTYHLHFEMETVVARPSDGITSTHTHLPPYATLIDAYKRMDEGNP
jgi:hypothetical protein